MHSIIKKMAVLSVISYSMISAPANACQNKPAEYLTDDLFTKGSQPAVKSYLPTSNTQSRNNSESKAEITSVDQSETSSSKPPEGMASVLEHQQLRSHM